MTQVAAEVAAARAEYADGEAEAAEIEIAEKNVALTIPLNIRIDADDSNNALRKHKYLRRQS